MGRVYAFAFAIRTVATQALLLVDRLAAHDAVCREAGGRCVQAGGHGGGQQQLAVRPRSQQQHCSRDDPQAVAGTPPKN